jgi:hypothetical protein
MDRSLTHWWIISFIPPDIQKRQCCVNKCPHTLASCKFTVRHLWRNEKRAGEKINEKRLKIFFHSSASIFYSSRQSRRVVLLSPGNNDRFITQNCWTLFMRYPCLISYTRGFGCWLYYRLQVTGFHCTSRHFIFIYFCNYPLHAGLERQGRCLDWKELILLSSEQRFRTVTYTETPSQLYVYQIHI